MSRTLTPKELIHLLHELQEREDVHPQSIPLTELRPQLSLLRQWQSERLAHTYADLLVDEHYSAACQFFLSDLYGPRDFSQRDHDAERLYEILSRFLPPAMLRLLADAIRMNQLTSRLDQMLVRVLVEQLGVTEAITELAYVEGYRLCDNYAERKIQIDLLVDILREAASGARNPIFGISLRLARGPALRAGWFGLYDFLERGYATCKPMRNVGYFVDTIRERETTILDKIYAGDPAPFDL
jgi:hypothetical protein